MGRTGLMVEITGAQAQQLLSTPGYGRLVYRHDLTDVVLHPAMHIFDEGWLIVRCPAPTEEVRRTPWIAYQTDQVDLASGRGWLVTVRGLPGTLKTGREEADYRQMLGGWSHGPYDMVLRILPTTIKGYRLVDGTDIARSW